MRNVFIMYVLILIVLFFCFQNLKPDLNINQTKQEPNITKVIFINNSDEKEIARLNQKIENQQNIIDSLRYNLSELMLSKQKNPNNYNGLYNFTNNKIEIFCNQAPKEFFLLVFMRWVIIFKMNIFFIMISKNIKKLSKKRII